MDRYTQGSWTDLDNAFAYRIRWGNCWHESAGTHFLLPFRPADNARLITVRRITCQCNHATRLKISNNTPQWCCAARCLSVLFSPYPFVFFPSLSQTNYIFHFTNRCNRVRDTISAKREKGVDRVHMHCQLCHPVKCCTR